MKMNLVLLQDKIFAVYTKLPHCLICKKKHIMESSSMGYGSLQKFGIMFHF